MARTKKKTTAKRKKKNEQALDKRQITAIILFFVHVLLFAFALIPGVKVWNAFHNFVLGLGGFWIYVWLIFGGYILALKVFDKLEGKRLRLIGVGSVVALVGTFIEIFAYNDEFSNYGEFIAHSYADGIKGCGVLGALFAYPFADWFGRLGAIIIVSLTILVLVLLLARITLQQFLTSVSKPVQKVADNAKVAYEQHKKRRDEKEWDISIAGMPEEPVSPIEHDSADITTKGNRLVAKYHDEEQLEELLTQEEVDDLNRRVGAIEPAPLTDVPVPEPSDLPWDEDEQPKKTMVLAEQEDGQQAFSGIQVEIQQKEAYRYPPINLLNQNTSVGGANQEELKNNAALLVDTLRSFGVETRILNISRGPSVTRYELQPAAGVKISKIKNLADDISLNLASSGVRIEAPIPDKAAVGIEVPNKSAATVNLREIIDSPAFEKAKSKLTVAVGKDITGNIITADLAKMPHLLIAGTTGSGKSVCTNSFILSILYKASPDDVKLLLIDPKIVEFEAYNGLPHLLVPVVTDAKKASGAFGWAVAEMERRYKIFSECKVRDLSAYNAFAEESDTHEKMPQILIVADELADLMMAAPAEVEDSICRLAQKARAAGMHLVLATQRPSVDVITGLIKANVPSRISLKVSNQIDSRTILDSQGAEKLLGKGDMLFYPVGMAKPTRVQGCWVSPEEIKNVVSYIIGDKENEYSKEISDEIERYAVESKGKKVSAMDKEDGAGEGDEMLPQAIEVVVEAGVASTSLLQRRLKLGYARAARIVDQLEEKGIVGPFEGAKPRKVLITKQQYEEMRMSQSD